MRKRLAALVIVATLLGAGTTAIAKPRKKTLDAQTYSVRLADLERRIAELKQQVYRRPYPHSPIRVDLPYGAPTSSQGQPHTQATQRAE
jgi:hypothetical protein